MKNKRVTFRIDEKLWMQFYKIYWKKSHAVIRQLIKDELKTKWGIE